MTTATPPPELLAALATLRPHYHPDQWTLETPLDDLGIDSLDRIRLAVALEATLRITIPDTAIADAHCLSDLARVVTDRSLTAASNSRAETGSGSGFPALRSAADDDAAAHNDNDKGFAGALGETFLHPTAEFGEGASVGSGSRIWHCVQLAAGVRVGAQCTLGKGVYLGTGTRVGNRVKIQNAVNVFGAEIHDEVMLCPGVLIVEDPTPRAVTADGTRQPGATGPPGQ